MNKIHFVSFFLLLLLSCENKQQISTENNDEIQEDYYEFQDFLLDDYELKNVVISLPDETASIGAVTDPEVVHDESYKWIITVGSKFELHILDQGELTDLISEEKKRITQRDFNKLTFIEETDSLIIYKKELIASGIEGAPKNVGTEHKSFHIFGVRKIGNYNYVLHSKIDGVNDQKALKIMKKSILSFKEFHKKKS